MSFVPREKYEDLRATVQKLYKDKGKLLQDLMSVTKHAEELEAKNVMLERTVRGGKICLGRTNLKRGNFSGKELVNNDIIGKLFKKKIFRKNKFLQKSWHKYLPNNPHSFYCKIIGYLDAPEDEESLELWWTTQIVPLVNKRGIKVRSNTNTYLRLMYISK